MEIHKSKALVEKEMIDLLKKELDSMKFSSKPEQFSKIFDILDKLMKSRGISKHQVDIILKRLRDGN